MSTSIKQQSKALEKLRLPDLQARFTDIVGEPTRSPNKKYLLRRISEALEAAEAGQEPTTLKRPAKPKAPQARQAAKRAEGVKKATAKQQRKAKQPTQKVKATATNTDKPRLSQLSVEELQKHYAETIGRPTGSQHKGYMIWKIRQAQKGHIRVGPASRRSSTDPADFKVIPLRMETEVVDQIDAARERLEIPSRTALIRCALMVYLARAGENDVAALLAPAE